MTRKRTGKGAPPRAPRSEPATTAATPAGSAPMRVGGIDALRGVALFLMFVYHFAFDLRYYGVISADFEHSPFWLGFRAVIVSSFMALVGVSLVLADRAGASKAHFWKRLGIIVACALAASIGSYLVFPRTFIYFGILHAIAVASLLAAPFVRRPRLALAIGVLIVAAAFMWSHPMFDTRALSWIGFTTHKPATEDYVPLFPWAGAVFVGIALGDALARNAFRAVGPLGGAPRWLRFLGRHSLAVYMLHQPILLGVLGLALR